MRKYLKIVDQSKASSGTRFANLIIDKIALYVIIFAIHIPLGIIYEFTGFEPIYNYLNYIEGLNDLEDLIFSTSLFLMYYFLMEHFTNGRTIGKYITGTKAISIDGQKVSSKQTLYRTLSRIVPFDAFSFLGTNGWHDSWSETRVVKIKTYQEQLRQKSDINEIGQNY